MIRLLPAAVLVAALLFAAGPFLFSFNGFDPELYPNPQTDPPAQPAGWAFSIWGLIYAWLVASAAFGFWKRADDPDWHRARAPLLIALASGAVWLPVAQRSPIWALILIWVMLIAALSSLSRTPAIRDRWLLRAPIGLFAGWLTAASWVSVALVGAGWGLGPDAATWAYLVVLLAASMAVATILWLGRLPTYAAAVAWGLFGIAIANLGERTTLGLLAAALCVVALVVGLTAEERQAARPDGGAA